MSEAVKLELVSSIDENQQQQILPKTVGQQLAAARTQLGLSVEQIASQLKWSSRQIAEIEAGNYAVLPDFATLRGFVRTYAKTLKVDAEPLVQQLTVEFSKLPVKVVDRQDLDAPFPTGRMPWLGRQNNHSQWMLGAAFLVFLCLLALFVYRAEVIQVVNKILPVQVEKAPTQAEPIAIADSAVKEASSNPVAQVDSKVNLEAKVERAEAVSTQPTNLAPAAAIPAPPISNNTSASETAARAQRAIESNKISATTSEEKAIEVKAGTSGVVTEASSAKDGALILSFKQDSWCQIKRADGSVVVSRLYRAGTQEIVNVGGALSMVIGNAPRVEATLRGQRLELVTQNGSNVANLSIK